MNSIPRLQGELLRIWRMLLRTESVSIDDDFFDVGGDSLLATELVLELQRLTGRTIPESLLFETATVRGVAERLAQTDDLQPKFAVRVGAASADTTQLLFFHGDWTSGGFYLRHLAQELGPDQPIVAIAPHQLGNGPVPSSIPAMAVDRLPTILETQPKGPFRLVGHCVGGIVAFETARLLISRGHRVEIVVLIDPPLSRAGEFLRVRRDSAPDGGGQDPTETPNDRSFLTLGDSSEPTERWYGECLAAYWPAPLAAPLVVFSSEFDATPWQAVSHDLEIIEIPGNHFDWVTKRAADFALRLRSRVRDVSKAANRERAVLDGLQIPGASESKLRGASRSTEG